MDETETTANAEKPEPQTQDSAAPQAGDAAADKTPTPEQLAAIAKLDRELELACLAAGIPRKLQFPDISREPCFRFDEQTGDVWLGFKLLGMGQTGAERWLDAQKWELHKIYTAVAIQRQRALQAQEEARKDPRVRRSLRDILSGKH